MKECHLLDDLGICIVYTVGVLDCGKNLVTQKFSISLLIVLKVRNVQTQICWKKRERLLILNKLAFWNGKTTPYTLGENAAKQLLYCDWAYLEIDKQLNVFKIHLKAPQ